MFFFLDNRRRVQYEWVFPLLNNAGWTVAKHWDGLWVLDSDEAKEALAAFKPLMDNHDPWVKGRIAWGLPSNADPPPPGAKGRMPMIISASYRTDIPAFYGAWFQRRLPRSVATRAGPRPNCWRC